MQDETFIDRLRGDIELHVGYARVSANCLSWRYLYFGKRRTCSPLPDRSTIPVQARLAGALDFGDDSDLCGTEGFPATFFVALVLGIVSLVVAANQPLEYGSERIERSTYLSKCFVLKFLWQRSHLNRS